jgi:hypothetical protein
VHLVGGAMEFMVGTQVGLPSVMADVTMTIMIDMLSLTPTEHERETIIYR